MREFDAIEWFLICSMVSAIRSEAEKRGANEPVEDADKLRSDFGDVLKGCEKAELKVSAELVRNQVSYLPKKNDPGILRTHGDIARVADTIADTIQAELNSITFFRLSDEYSKYYGGKLLFGGSVDAVFPSAISDIEEAGKCLALARGTATVFHVMRVVELGLKILSNELGIPYAPSWESYIKQIEAKIAQPHKSKTKGWKRLEPFYRDVLGDLQAVKISWRNPTMHIVRTYQLEEAEDIFRASRTFMKRLADHLLAQAEAKNRAKAAREK